MPNKNKLTAYESTQLLAIKAWKKKEPSVVSQAAGVVTYPLTWVAQKVIPSSAIRGVLDASNWAARGLTNNKHIVKRAEIEEIGELKNKDLELCDTLANRAHNWAVGMAIAEGGGTGAAGVFGLAVDIPAIITMALRTVHMVGLCYGYKCNDDLETNYIYGVLSASGANSMEEKTAALMTLRSIQVTVAKTTWKAMTEKAATQQLSKEGGIIAVKNLAKQLGINLTKRKALQVIPALGAGVGASVNGVYVKDVGWAARRSFQERWLLDNDRVER